MPFIDVIVPLPINQTFTYRVREAEAAFLRPGMRVVVPFGRNKLRTAIVLRFFAALSRSATSLLIAPRLHTS